VVLIWFFSPLVVQILTQSRFVEFQDAVPVLRILSLAMFVAYFNHLTGFTIVALGKQRSYFFVALGALVFNLIVNWLVIPRFSYFGAAWVTLLTESLVLVVTTVFVFRLINLLPSLLSFPKTIGKIVKRKNDKIF